MKKKKKRFHQFVVIEKGPVNSAIMDFLKGRVYQVENEFIKKFEEAKYEEIPDFVHSLQEEGLIIEVEEKAWIPVIEPDEEDDEELSFMIEIEEGADPALVKRRFSDFTLSGINYYGEDPPAEIIPDVAVSQAVVDFDACLELSRVTAEFFKLKETHYRFNREFNSCWGKKIAVMRDGKVRPCIYSEVVIGDLNTEPAADILERARGYWEITKDKVKRCRDCELRYICFDCREIARREENDLHAPNPHCSYDPHTGKWADERDRY
jgi:radical SAM protein with 4Fe4S-binding SPASM domain